MLNEWGPFGCCGREKYVRPSCRDVCNFGLYRAQAKSTTAGTGRGVELYTRKVLEGRPFWDGVELHALLLLCVGKICTSCQVFVRAILNTTSQSHSHHHRGPDLLQEKIPMPS